MGSKLDDKAETRYKIALVLWISILSCFLSAVHNVHSSYPYLMNRPELRDQDGGVARSVFDEEPVIQTSQPVGDSVSSVLLHEDGESFSACLLVMDENPRLPEWLAYHY